MNKSHPLLQPYKPTSDDPFDATKAAHLLNRAGFGGRPEEIVKVVEMGPQRAVDWLLDFPDAPAEEQSKTDVPDLSSIDGYPKNFREMRSLYVGKTQEERKAIVQQLQQANREANGETVNWWMRRMVHGPYPLQEKLTLFWHGHFTTSAKDERSAWLMWQQNELLRQRAAGNFHQFVRAISRDPAMLDYLNNTQNHKQHPNENYARELMELFTLGIGNYSEDDIKNSARAFTGWTHDGDDFVFRKFDHDEGTKYFFNRSGNFDGDDIVELIMQHPACAPYVASKMFKFFVYEDLEDGLAEALGNLLRENKYEMRPLIQTMLTSKAFYSPRAIGSQIKSPVQLVIGTMRMLDLKVPNTRMLMGAMSQMGQVPFAPPNVKGWAGGRMWINTSTLFVRYNTASAMVAGGSLAPMYGRKGGQRPQQNNLSDPKLAITESGSSEKIVEAWLSRLIQRPVEDEKKKVLIEALGENPREDSVKKMLQLIVSMPEYQLC
ncbi:MAG TPA: DUF1800 domain-containing protein [Tepidisphaeraceae bacterium]|jgi:hypothetical protein|nr:DUF1800 domain-containing protein [Tepidisphaeraceae bacterium]